jgi:hypothetical protein
LVQFSSPAREVQPVAPTAQAQVRTEAPQAAPEGSAPAPLKASIPDAGHPFAAVHSAGGSSSSGGPELGYVERANGQVEAFVAEGEHVGLRKAPKSFPSEFRAPLIPSVNSELASDRPPKVYSPESAAAAPPPGQPSPSVEQASTAPAVALQLEASDADKVTEPPASVQERGSESPEDVMPGFSLETAFADYAGPSTEPRDVPGDGQEGAPGGPLAAGLGEALAPESGDSAPATEPPARGSAALSFVPVRFPLVNALGYVEKEGGEKEAIVEIFGQVYLAHEGELLAGKFRVLQVTSSSIRIVDETRERSALPAMDTPEIEPVAPAVSRPDSPPGPQPRRRAYPVLVGPADDEHQYSAAKFALSQPPPEFPGRSAAGSLSVAAMPARGQLIGAPLSLSPPAPGSWSGPELDLPPAAAAPMAGGKGAFTPYVLPLGPFIDFRRGLESARRPRWIISTPAVPPESFPRADGISPPPPVLTADIVRRPGFVQPVVPCARGLAFTDALGQARYSATASVGVALPCYFTFSRCAAGLPIDYQTQASPATLSGSIGRL